VNMLRATSSNDQLQELQEVLEIKVEPFVESAQPDKAPKKPEKRSSSALIGSAAKRVKTSRKRSKKKGKEYTPDNPTEHVLAAAKLSQLEEAKVVSAQRPT
jgi:hypothetical protein